MSILPAISSRRRFSNSLNSCIDCIRFVSSNAVAVVVCGGVVIGAAGGDRLFIIDVSAVEAVLAVLLVISFDVEDDADEDTTAPVDIVVGNDGGGGDVTMDSFCFASSFCFKNFSFN